MNICLNCGKETKTKFCSSSCSASFNNRNRVKSQESKEKVRNTLRKLHKSELKFENQIEGPYCLVYICTCKISGITWISKTRKTIHPDLKDTYKQYSYSCRFNFSINRYPEWFTDASELIKTYGWYSTPGSTKKGKINLNGISRDHRFSVSDGFKNNVPPDIISHPANCALLPHSQNQTKHSKSSISLDVLYQDIERFETLFGKPPR